MTIYGLADKVGLAHSVAERIASDMRPYVRLNTHTGQLSHYDEARLRRAFLGARPAPRPALAMPPLPGLEPETPPEQPKPEGVTLALIVQKTGIAEGTIKSLVSRHAELQELPYSAKSAGARVFFPAFAEWLAEHQGAEVAKVARAATSATRLPAGAQLRELRLMGEKKILSPAQIQRLLGVEEIIIPRLDEPKASEEEAAAAFRAIKDRLGLDRPGHERETVGAPA